MLRETPDGADLRDQIAIVPSHRAATRLRKALARSMAQTMNGTGWLPRFVTLSEWLREVSGLQALSQLEALTLLYEQHRALAPEKTPGFSAFQPWGEVALRDFNTCDNHLIAPETFFKNLCDLKELDVWGVQDWSFDAPELTPGQQAYLDSFLMLEPLYRAMREASLAQGRAIGGTIARRVAESGAVEGPSKIWAIGLSVLTPAEMAYLKRWEGAGRLAWMWDADRSYVDGGQGVFEAGLFIRKQAGPEEVATLPNRLASDPPAMRLIGCSSAVYEVAWVRDCIAQLSQEERDVTAVVLPDAATLPLLLQGLGDVLPECNITMGIAWEETPAAEWLEAVWRMFIRSGQSVRHDEIAPLCGHAIPLLITGREAMLADAGWVRQSVAEGHRVWLAEADIQEMSSGPVAEWMGELLALKAKVRDISSAPQALLDWSLSILNRLESAEESDPWSLASWRKWTQAMAAFTHHPGHEKLAESLKDLRDLLRTGIRGERVDLVGEPDKGLQIMGLIETRAIDFERVIVLDCNEQMLPKSGMDDSFLPAELRAAHELPGRHEREAIYAYYLYRLFNRAKEVVLLYRDSEEASEPSRYLRQLRSSFRPNGTDLLPIEELHVQAPLPAPRPDAVPLTLTPKMRERLVTWATTSGISPSALNTWVACERDFSYKYLLRMREPNALEESMDVSTFGSILHEALENLFKERLNRPLRIEDFEEALGALDAEIGQSIARIYNPRLVEIGENRLLQRMIRATARKMLKAEQNEIRQGTERTLLGLEETIAGTYPGSGPFSAGIQLKGSADRIERENGTLTIVDYKSGKVEKKDVTLKGDDLGQVLDAGEKPKALQLLVYSAIGLQRFQEHVARAAIRSGRNAYVGGLAFSWQGEEDIEPAHVDEFIAWLDARLVTLHAETAEVQHDENSAYCTFCQTWGGSH